MYLKSIWMSNVLPWQLKMLYVGHHVPFLFFFSAQFAYFCLLFPWGHVVSSCATLPALVEMVLTYP